MRLLVKFSLVGVILTLLSACGGGPSGPITYGGYVIDVTTGKALDGYSMEVELADGKWEIDSDNGKFQFNTPAGADYIIRVNKEGYKSFVSTNRHDLVWSDEGDAIYENLSLLYNVPMVPSDVNTPQVSISVVDAETTFPIDRGSFRLTSTGPDNDLYNSLYRDGEDENQLKKARWWLPNAPLIAGRFSDGHFSIASNALLPGFNYKISIFNVKGYDDEKANFSLDAGQFNLASKGPDRIISMKRYEK